MTAPARSAARPRPPVMIRDGGIEDWADIWPFFRQILAAGETFCLPNIMIGSDARNLWFGGDATVLVAVDPRRKPYVVNPTSPIVGATAGTVRLRPRYDGHGKHVASAAFVVDPVLSGQGIGRQLTISALARAKRDGFTGMQLDEVVATNTAALALWESMGFAVVGTVPRAFDHPELGYVNLHTLYRDL